MCEPSTLMAAGMAVSAISAVGQGVSSYQQGKYQAAEMENRAKVAGWQADQSIEQARQQQIAHDRETARQMGEMGAIQAASGFRMDSGSLLDVSVDSAREAAIDRQNIKHQGDLNAWGYQNQANSLLASASNARRSGKNALIGGVISGAGSLLAGAGGLYDSMGGGAESIMAESGKKGSMFTSSKKAGSLFSFKK